MVGSERFDTLLELIHAPILPLMVDFCKSFTIPRPPGEKWGKMGDLVRNGQILTDSPRFFANEAHFVLLDGTTSHI